MASLEHRQGHYRLVFRYQGQKYQHALHTDNPDEAEACRLRLEENLRLLERGRLELIPGADLAVFLLSDGKLNGKPSIKKPLTLSEFFDRYKTELPEGVKEANTLYIEAVHIKHLLRLLGSRTPLSAISTEALQAYVDARAKEKGQKGRLVSHVTVRKEMGTLASAWNKFGVPKRLVEGWAPTKGLMYRKTNSKLPFQTWEQIERQIARGGLSEQEQESLWDALFLSLDQIEAILSYVRGLGQIPWLYPMFRFVAHTGARRSEMLRSRIDDLDFTARMIRIREKKRDRTKDVTFRYVPMSEQFASDMTEWLTRHPGGQYTLSPVANEPVTMMMAAHRIVDALADSKWDKLRGWHVFRHSFASNCAAKGVDQRLIDEWMGHQTDDMRRRYRHLFPDQQRQAIQSVFGSGRGGGKGP